MRLERDDAAPIAADAGFAGVGRYGVRSKDEPLEVVMARVSGPDFEREWAELVSAQTSLS